MALITREEARQEVLRRIGGHVGEVDSGTTTTAVVQELAYVGSGDDNHFVNWRLNMPDLTDAITTRVASAWDDSTGQFTWATATTDTIADTDAIEIYPPAPDPFVKDLNDAIDRTLQETERLVETVLPTVEGQYRYPLPNAPWIEHMGDVEKVMYRLSPNLLDNATFEYWGRGSDDQLAAWTLSGASSTVTRVRSDYSAGQFAANVARSDTNAILTQTIPIQIDQLRGETISCEALVKTATASIARIQINDGASATASSTHSGGGGWETLTITHTVDSSADGPLDFTCEVVTSDGNADFERVVAVEASSVDSNLQDYGDQHFRLRDIKATVQMHGSLPVVHLPRTFNRGSQIVVISRQPFAPLTADTDTTDMQLECLAAGAIVKLAEVYGKGQHRERWDALGSLWRPVYESWKARYIQHGNLNPTPRRQVIGAA